MATKTQDTYKPEMNAALRPAEPLRTVSDIINFYTGKKEA